MTNWVDLGMDHQISLAEWDPDLALNPSLEPLRGHVPITAGAIVRHLLPGNGWCEGAITFDLPEVTPHFSGPYWQVERWNPLSLMPSLLCHCGDHGFIRQGRWSLTP